MARGVYFHYDNTLITYSDQGTNPDVLPCECPSEEHCDREFSPDGLYRVTVCLNRLARRGHVGACDCSCSAVRVWGFMGKCIWCHPPEEWCVFHA